MALKKLELIGFKSFAKRTSMTFASSITAIVGPNGSGKSNAAEAFRFVLGEQSMKSLRGKRTEDLIFNGSTKVPRTNRARAELTFDNTSRLLDIDFDEVIISRTIHRDATSEYALNGSLVRLKDIQELLAGAHVGSSGHHIISQGAADRVLLVNPRERREMIEDALGLRVYQYKIDESVKKLERTRDNIEKVESLRREIKPHLTFLKRQVEKLERARELREELIERYKEYFRRESLYIENKEKELRDKKKPLENEKSIFEQQRIETEKCLAELDAEMTHGDDTSSVENEIRLIREKKDILSRLIGRLEGAIEIEKRRSEKVPLEKKEAEYIQKGEVKKLFESIVGYLHQAEKTEVLEEVRELLRSAVQAFQTFWGTIEEIVAPASEEMSDAELKKYEAELVLKEKEMHVLATEEEILQRKVIEYKWSFEKEQHEGREVERRLFGIREKVQQVKMQLEKLEGEAERLVLVREECQRELLEAGTLVGREAVHFSEAVLQDTKGNLSTPEEASTEERQVQEARKRTLEKLKIRFEEAGATTGEDVLKEYTQATERDEFLAKEIVDLTTSAESLVSLIGDLTQTLENQFKEGIEKINSAFGDFFAVMFGGGSAILKVVEEKRRKKISDEVLGTAADVEEIEEEGIEIGITLPHKKIHGLQMLSGGERALTSIALIFAMSQVNPPPFLILDETDAALDEANSRRYGDMIERLAEHSQLILITHNRETMSRADVLYGVTMGGEGVSQVLSVGFTEAVQGAK